MGIARTDGVPIGRRSNPPEIVNSKAILATVRNILRADPYKGAVGINSGDEGWNVRATRGKR